jgi:hypothetical protein
MRLYPYYEQLRFHRWRKVAEIAYCDKCYDVYNLFFYNAEYLPIFDLSECNNIFPEAHIMLFCHIKYNSIANIYKLARNPNSYFNKIPREIIDIIVADVRENVRRDVRILEELL